MFKRKAIESLKEWKAKWAGDYAVLLEGARRVGKSTIAETFAKENYKSYILVDFSDFSEDLQSIFKSISNRDLFFLRLQDYFKTKLYERKSVIIFDEIQFYPPVRQAIKHLVKDGRYDYIETGLLISIHKNSLEILNPSEEMRINVYPMDYEEFCWATGENCEAIKELVSLNRKLDSTNRLLMSKFRIYMAVGGMPQAVDAYLKKRTFQEIDVVKREIIALYKEDFRKIDPNGRIGEMYESIPSQLALKRKFVISYATGKRETERDKRMMNELIASKTVLPCYRVREPKAPLKSTRDTKDYKLYVSDVGLFVTLLLSDKKVPEEKLYGKLLSDKLNANLSYLYENVVAQIIASTNRDLLYFTWKDNHKKKPHEIDFLLSDGNKVIPVEVKSSDIKNHASITAFSSKYSSCISRRVLFSQNDFGNEGMLELKPLYSLPCFLENIDKNSK